MATPTNFGTLRAKIADDLARSNLTTQIGDAINEAIADLDAERFWFNNQRSLTFNTVAGQEFYSSSDNANIPNIIRIDQLIVGDGTNDEWPAIRKDNDLLELLDPPSTRSQPRLYAYIESKIRLWPKPDIVYSCRVTGWYRLAELSNDGDTNVWIQNAWNLVRLSARRRVQANVIRDNNAALATYQLENEALDRLRRETILRMGYGTIKPTRF